MDEKTTFFTRVVGNFFKKTFNVVRNSYTIGIYERHKCYL